MSKKTIKKCDLCDKIGEDSDISAWGTVKLHDNNFIPREPQWNETNLRMDLCTKCCIEVKQMLWAKRWKVKK